MMAQVSSKKCQICSQEDAKFYCYECQYVLCEVCKQHHNQIPNVAGHMVTDLSTIDIADMNNNSKCSNHQKEFLCFCLQCNILICGKCVTSSHNGHSFAEIDETVSKERKKAEEKLLDLRNNIEESENLISIVRNDHIELLKADSKQLKQRTKEFYDGLCSVLKQRNNFKVNNAEDQELNAESNFNHFIRSIEKMVKDFRLLHSKLKNLLKEKHHVTFYRSFKDLCFEIDNLDEVPAIPATICVPPFDARQCYEEIVDHMHSKLKGKCCRSCTMEHKQKIQTLEDDIKRYRASSKQFEKLFEQSQRELLLAKEKCVKYKMNSDHYEELNYKYCVDSIQWYHSDTCYFCKGCRSLIKGVQGFKDHLAYSKSCYHK